MAENQKNTLTEAPKAETEKTSRVKSFIAKHPRAAQVAGFTAATAVVVGVVAAIKNKTQSDNSDPDTTGLEDLSQFDAETTFLKEA